MSDKAGLLSEAGEAFDALRSAVTGLDEGPLRRVWLGAWGVREILIHISGWHREMIPALARIGRGEEPYPKGTYDDFDAWNARFVAGRRAAGAAEIHDELEASHRAFVTAVAALGDAHLGAGAAARSIVEGTGAGHYREHAAQILEWRRAQAS